MSHHRVCLVASILSLLVPVAARAQTGPAHLIKDINTSITSAGGSYPNGFISFRGQAFFTANTLETGEELWKSDGTDGGTVLVKDIQPGPFSSLIGSFTVAGDTLFFFADDGVHGSELWKSDGTEAGTVLVRDIVPGPEGSNTYGYYKFAAIGGTLLFVANDLIHGTELWKSDGTEAGTSLVIDSQPGPTGSDIGSMTALDGAAVFTGYDDVHGYELWRSDGTEAGTHLLADLTPGPQGSSVGMIGRAGPFAYFAAGPYHDTLFKTDGSSAGTSFVSYIGDLLGARGIEHAGDLFFTSRTYYGATDLWKTDGSEDGTELVREFPAGLYDASGIVELAEFDGGLYFVFSPGDDASLQLWTTGGYLWDTALVKQLDAGGNGSLVFFLDLTPASDALVFVSFDDAHGYELWGSDGSPAGTALLDDIWPGIVSAGETGLTSVNGTVFFRANDGVHMPELWKTDGTAAGTGLVKDINSRTFTADSSPSSFVALGRKTVFSAIGAAGFELWASDGTEAGTHLVKDILPGPGGSIPRSLTLVGDTVFFLADDGVHGRELWKTDGTEAGTVLVRDVRPGPASSNASLLNVAYGVLFFDPDDGIHGSELWRSDGTEEGTYLVKDINPGPAPSYPLETPKDNPALFFDADDGIHGFELWTSDGTEAGTVLVKDINPGPSSSFTGNAYQVNGVFLFDADDGLHGREMWKTDGSEAGTALLEDIRPGPSSSSPSMEVNGDGALFFRASDGFSGGELWKSDGTAAGTVIVNVGPGYVDNLTRVGGTMFFTSYNDDFTANDLWKTDGTEAGTVVVKSFPTDEFVWSPRALAAAGPALFFSVGDEAIGPELWRSDGTEDGTVLAQDLAPGPFWGQPSGMTLVGSRLFFSAVDPVLGREPWAGRVSILAHRLDLALGDLRDDVLALGLSHGDEQSLLVKLDSVERALARDRGTRQAILLLEVFERDLESKSPAPISEAQAADLLEFAEEIKVLLQERAEPIAEPVRRTLGERSIRLDVPRGR